MSKRIMIVGPSGSGKTRKARELAAAYNRKKVVWMNEGWRPGLQFYFRAVTRETKLIVLDEVFDDESFAPTGMLRRETMTVHRQAQPSIEVKVPDVIVVLSETMSDIALNTLTRITNGFEIIDMTSSKLDNI